MSSPRSLETLTPRRSVRWKLMGVVLITTAMALLVAGAALLTRDLQDYRRTWTADLATEASILALSTAPALAFDDLATAKRNLAALRARRGVLVAAIYLADGKLFAQYARPGEQPAPERLPALEARPRTSGEHVELTQRVVQNGEWLGTIYLRGRYDVLGRVRDYLGILGLVTLMSMVVALILSTALQRVIIRPLDAMAAVARHVVTSRDYSPRAAKTTDDEIGLLVEAFNSMLDEVQGRTRELEQSNAALEAEVHSRKVAERALALANARLESSMAAAEIGSWIWDLRTDEISGDRNLAALYGLADQRALAGEPTRSLRNIYAQDLSAMSARAPSVRGSGILEPATFQIVRPDGSVRWVASRGKVHFEPDGTQTLAAGLLIDVTAQKAAEQALREADRRKDEFLATLAHELRNPLAPIRHAVTLLESPKLDDRHRKWSQEVISRQVQRMALLLDDLLDVSRITRGRLELRKDYVALASLVGSSIETARPLIDAKGHSLSVVLPPEPIELEVDPLRLSQALSNLLTNAAKYTDAGGEIVLRIELTEAQLNFTVSDTGIGLSAGSLPTLFEMFSQVDSAIDRAEGGLGIGLALVKGLVTLHGGSVDAASAGPGRGSTFTIHLPRTAVTQRRVRGEQRPARADLGRAARCTVLIADDNRDAAESLALVLKSEGYVTHLAHTGRDALALALRERPDALVLDIGMPEMNGYELARHIRREAWGKRALLLAVTGWGQRDDKDRAAAAGFDHHLTKPVATEALEQLLAQFSERSAAQAAQPERSEPGRAGS
ncbi:MAG TPA: ATP-binding protein [Steroidobacteraceae bacterium]|nr:ATP-binding protein [Steroidobacteraceae bacterium]